MNQFPKSPPLHEHHKTLLNTKYPKHKANPDTLRTTRNQTGHDKVNEMWSSIKTTPSGATATHQVPIITPQKHPFQTLIHVIDALFVREPGSPVKEQM